MINNKVYLFLILISYFIMDNAGNNEIPVSGRYRGFDEKHGAIMATDFRHALS